MLLPTKAAEINTHVRRKFHKHSNIIHLLLIALIVLSITVYLVHEHYPRICRESVKQKYVTRNLLYENVRVFCLIMILQPNNIDVALKVHKTWATHCNRALFVSSNMHDVLEPLIILEPVATPEQKWMRLKLALRYVYENHFDEAGWFLIADDHNFVILENLRYMLEHYSPDKAINFGCKMKDKTNQTYMHGSYVLSREALRRLVDVGFTNSSICNLADSPYDNEELGRCLRNVNVIAGDSRDAMGRQRFVPFPPGEYLRALQPDKQEWYTKQSYYDINPTTRGMSTEVISFSNVDAATMVTLYYYIYKLRIFGRQVPTRNVTAHFESEISFVKQNI